MVSGYSCHFDLATEEKHVSPNVEILVTSAKAMQQSFEKSTALVTHSVMVFLLDKAFCEAYLIV